MMKHKSLHPCGLDSLVFNNLKNNPYSNEYYLYIYDFCAANKLMSDDFFDPECNSENTWNYDLKFEDTAKDVIMKNNVRFGLGDIDYDASDDYIIVKGRNHFDSCLQNGQAHKVKKEEFETNYDTDHFIGQKILKSSDTHMNEELNIFVVRNLKTKELSFFCVMCSFDTRVSVNRKNMTCETRVVDIDILGDTKKKFINFMNHINFDYGRIELIKDKDIGWCVIDINNSPGGGPITHRYHGQVSNLFVGCME
jgi:hypothetical protein